MRHLNVQATNAFLAPVDLKIGEWSEVCDAHGWPYSSNEWLNFPAPQGGLALYCFSHRILLWLTLGAEKLLQIDGSTNFSDDEAFLISRLLLGHSGLTLSNDVRSFVFETNGTDANYEQWLLGDVIAIMLLFGHHCQVVSKEAAAGQHISMQDGYVYFLSRNPDDLVRARELIDRLRAEPFPRPGYTESAPDND